MPRPIPTFKRAASLLSVAVLATACGGGGGGDSAAPSNVQVTVSMPTTSGGVFSIQSPVSVQAQVTVNGAAATDGTAVALSLPGGSFAPVAPVTRSGTASSTLTATTTGPQVLTASATVNGATGTSTQTIYLRPAPAAIELLVPAYFHPSTNTGWSQLAAAASATPSVSITAILNPSNGVFTAADSQTLQAARTFVNAGGKVVGYVYTRYGTGTRSLADIKANIDRYFNLYGSNVVSGIFLDEMASTTGQIDFYREIYQYIKARDANLRVIGNPGAIPATATYAGVADALVTFEGTGTTFQTYDPRTNAAWIYTLANTRNAALVHNADTCAAMQSAVQTAALARNNQGLVYATDLQYNPTTQVGNPWASLPSYWTSLVATVQAINAGTALPSC